MMPRVSPVFALLFALVVAAPAAAQDRRDRGRDRDWDRDQDRGPRETETVDRTLSLQAGGTVRLKTFSGRVNITGGSGNQVVIKAVRRATRQRLDEIKLEITQNGNVIDIDANHRLVERRNDNVVETDFDIHVPSQVRLDLRTFSAPVTVATVTGDLEVEGFSGEVRLTDVWRDGDDLTVNTFSGDVTLRLPAAARGDLQFDSFSGSFNSDLPVTLTTSSKRNFRGSLNGGGGSDLRLTTFSGDVTIRK
jgi:DUF4097 and DUF4098 domain-containing protein YvlB